MVCFPHMMIKLYSWSVAVDDGSTPLVVNSRLECLNSCERNTTCSSLVFSQQTSSCYLYHRWLNSLVSSTPTGYDYFIMYPEDCQLPGYQFVRSVGMCLQFFIVKKHWQTAKEACESDGARLVKIDSEDKMSIIWEIITTDYPGMNFWIGANDPLENQHWVWTDGSTVGYFKWAAGEPSRNAACMELWQSGGGFDDASCNSLIGYICEKL